MFSHWSQEMSERNSGSLFLKVGTGYVPASQFMSWMKYLLCHSYRNIFGELSTYYGRY